MKITLLDNGTLLVPVVIQDQGIIGDVIKKIMTRDKEYEKYLKEYYRERKLEKEENERLVSID